MNLKKKEKVMENAILIITNYLAYETSANKNIFDYDNLIILQKMDNEYWNIIAIFLS